MDDPLMDDLIPRSKQCAIEFKSVAPLLPDAHQTITALIIIYCFTMFYGYMLSLNFPSIILFGFLEQLLTRTVCRLLEYQIRDRKCRTERSKK